MRHSSEIFSATAHAKNKRKDAKRMTNSAEYLAKLTRFNDFYLVLVVICISLCTGATAIAILLNLPVGILIAIAAAILYAYLSTYRAYSLLGLRFKNVCGTVHLTEINCESEHTIFVPDRFVWAAVTHIEDGALASGKNSELSSVYIPRGIEYIGKDVFGKNASHVTVFFEGNEAEWISIDKHTDFSSVTVTYSTPFPRLEKKTKKESRSTVEGAEADT